MRRFHLLCERVCIDESVLPYNQRVEIVCEKSVLRELAIRLKD